MSIKPSHSLLAAMALIAAPAFAQDTATPEADAPTNDSTVQLPADAEKTVEEAGDAAAEAAAEETGDAATGAETAPADDSAEAESGESAQEEATDTPADAAAGETAGEDTAPEEGATPAEDPAETDTGEAAPATEQAEPAADAAAEESGEPKVGSYYAKSTHQDWTIRCIKADQGTDPCELYQLLKDGEGNSVAEMTLIPLSNGDVAAGATMVVPLETDLTRGLSLSVDGGEARGYPFSFCAPVGCVSRMGFTGSELSGLKRGGKASISLLPFGADPEKPVELELSLAGFTAAFDELSALAAEARAAAEAQAKESGAAEEEAPAE